jgi:soluble lytic murein transglycosylase
MAACTLLACSDADTERTRFITEILQERAKHLQSTERAEIVTALLRAERKTGVDALLLFAVAERESHFRPRAKSRRGALGLVQVRPATGREVCRRNRIPWHGDDSLFEPSLNVLIGATYLAELRERFESWDLALTAYNQGPRKARRAASRGQSPSSRYSARVLRRFESLREEARKATDRSRSAR